MEPSVSMAPTPRKSGGFDFCFSGDNSVYVDDERRVVFIQDLQLGDRVLTAKKQFEKVYSFGHLHRSRRAEYLQVDFGLPGAAEQGRLEVSDNHLVFLQNASAPVPASLLRIGDRLELTNGSGMILSIGHVMREGVFAPFTKSGTIVVSGVVASTFVAFQNSSTLHLGSNIDTGFSFQWFATAFEAPHRIWCSLAEQNCKAERYTSSGVSVWVYRPLTWIEWLVSQDDAIMCLCILPLLTLFALLCALDVLVCAIPSLALMVLVWAVARWKHLPLKTR